MHAVAVINPRVQVGRNGSAVHHAMETLRAAGITPSVVETSKDGSHIIEMTQRLRHTTPQLVIAAGGDGTVSDVAHAMMRTGAPGCPTLAILPLGTANNVARSLGLESCRHEGRAAVDLAVHTALAGVERRIDLGRVGERYFVGSFAVGMDADILHTRNRVRARLGFGSRTGGYPLYLLSCAFNLLRPHTTAAHLILDRAASTARIYNLLITNTSIYAGEFRFDAENAADDGRLDLHLFSGAFDYLRRYPQAWRRHVHYTRGDAVTAPVLRRVRELHIELAHAVPCQLDGEEHAAAARYAVRVVPRALLVRVPARR